LKATSPTASSLSPSASSFQTITMAMHLFVPFCNLLNSFDVVNDFFLLLPFSELQENISIGDIILLTSLSSISAFTRMKQHISPSSSHPVMVASLSPVLSFAFSLNSFGSRICPLLSMVRIASIFVALQLFSKFLKVSQSVTLSSECTAQISAKRLHPQIATKKLDEAGRSSKLFSSSILLVHTCFV